MDSMNRLGERVIRFGLFAPCLLLGCSNLFGPTRGEFEENLAIWEEAGIGTYRYMYQRLCFCVNTDAVTIEVRDGSITSVTLVETGEPAEAVYLDTYLTIDEIFEEIQDAIERDAHELSVTYHETFGYPTSVDIDYNENTIDEEMSYRASNLIELQ